MNAARVQAKVWRGYDCAPETCTMLGAAARREGKPTLVHVELDDGRLTWARFADVTPMNREAEALLKAAMRPDPRAKPAK